MAKKSIHRPEYDVFAGLLRDVRIREALTQGQLAERLAIDQSMVSDAERAVRRLDIVQIRDWAQACGLSLDAFVQEFEQRLREMDQHQGWDRDGRRNPVNLNR